MQKGGSDADDGLIHPQQHSGGVAGTVPHGQTTPTPPPQAGTLSQLPSACLQSLQQSQSTPDLPPQMPQLVLQGSQIQSLGGPATIVQQAPGGLTAPQLRGFLPQSATGYYPICPPSHHTSPSLHPQILTCHAHCVPVGRRIYSSSTMAGAPAMVTCASVLSPSIPLHSGTVLPASAFHRQLSAEPGGVIHSFPQQTVPLVSSQMSGAIGSSPMFLASKDQTGVQLGPIGQPIALPSNTSISASGGTIHHHGQSPTRGGLPPLTSPQQTMSGANVHTTGAVQQQRRPRDQGVAGPSATATINRNLFEGLTKSLAASSAVLSGGPSPRKRQRVEEKPPATPEIANNRKVILEAKGKELRELKECYIEHLTELFFLQNGLNMMDYFTWKRRPTPQLVHFLKTGNLDSDEEEDHQVQMKTYNDEVKVLTGAGSNIPLATPVAISTTLPPNVTALNQGTRNTVPASQGQLSLQQSQSVAITTTTTVAATSSSLVSSLDMSMATTSSPDPSIMQTTGANPLLSPRSPPAAILHSQLAKCIAGLDADKIKTALTKSLSGGSPKSRFSLSHRNPKQPIGAVYDSTLGSQEAIVERAKQEAQVMQRVADLRKEGMWSSRRLPKVQEPPRNKAHWDYLLEEMQWLAADFAQERKWKKAGARKIARMVAKYHQELHQKEVRAEKEEAMKLRRIASQLAKQIKEFWTNIEKVVQYKHQTRLEEKRKKALDLHLNFIVDQTEKYSTWLTEGLTGSTAGSVCSDTLTDQAQTSGDEDFQPVQEDSDDEETIDIEEKEAGIDETSTLEEIEALQKESELPIEDLIKSLPQAVLSTTASLDGEEEEVDVEGHEEDERSSKEDEEFQAGSQEEEDMEDTIEEQEKHERGRNRKKEMEELEAEGVMSMEELMAKYGGAYDSDFEFPEDSTDEGETDEDDESEDADTEDTEEEEGEAEAGEEEGEETEVSQDEVGLEFLMNPEEKAPTAEGEATAKKVEEPGPGKEITDIAAEALSLQPKGYTLQTTEVKTKVPFLLKHKLREYQHVGLNWLVTMYEKRLNGILADEMGLGKTIQTIALLAHLACEKGVWGPHLIVVPTSVMLNWEMEIKKWCPAFKILTYYGNQKERKQKRQGWTKTNAFHICITSYKLVIQDHQSFRRKKWKYLILDEAQNIKNFKSQRWQTLLNFSSQRRLLLTGTPLQNSLMELWSLMHFLMPNVFQSHKEFKEWFANPLTGMIEGSHEYNESLIRRLHKVLRPFLLRRLKDDVEKQMPKKYEHVVMCKLSKRQRYLYDDFMSQTKTKETLATGHFMSVINILMQLRKVCNHPNLFDPRPIVSPFQMEGIVHRTASLVLRALEHDPFQMLDIRTFFPSLVSMEMDLPAFVAHRVKNLQATKQLIVEIDSQPDPPPRPKPARKPIVFRSSSPLVQPGSGRASPLTVVSQTVINQTRPASPVTIVRTAPSVLKTPISQVMPVPMRLPISSTASLVSVQKPLMPSLVSSLIQQTGIPTTVLVTSAEQALLPRPPTTIATVQATMQTKIPTVQGSAILTTSGGSLAMPSQPITVQIQQTEQGTRLMIPSGQLSQLPAGFLQIVQTSTGQPLITTTNPSTPVQSVVPVQVSTATAVTPIVNGVPVATVAASLQPTSTVCMATSTPILISQPKPSPFVQLPLATMHTAGKPIMRVSPLATTSTMEATKSLPVTLAATTSVGSPLVMKSQRAQPKTAQALVSTPKPVVRRAPKPKSEYHMVSLEDRRLKCRKEKLEFISKLNKRHCDGKPVYGQDFYKSVNLMQDTEHSECSDCMWKGQGYVHCYNAQHFKNPHRTGLYLSQTESLSRLIHTPEQYLQELCDILKRYVFVTPSVMAPVIKLHAPHPPPSFLFNEERRKYQLHAELAPKTACLHSMSTKMTVLFPELRLIQYDCGKLQTMDILLRKLKSGDHRVLVFTQMTKMLDILETFLNYHGHRYLRLDGTTKVEQRQALMDRFNADRRIFCFILSTRSGGIGVNLTGADTVIFYDSDWNPTMDAQAQDRCHRIGQTRDVHIYRLISEKTIEENILKKANQKRLLGDLAIEGGSFTTAFFKESTLNDLFEEPSGLDQLAKEKAERKEAHARVVAATDHPVTPAESKAIVAKFEEALCKAEDETDVIAANQVRAEQKAELAEFDENIPWDEKERKKEEDEVSKVEMELAMLEKELSPVERYAVGYMESQLEPYNVEELEIAEEEVAVAKNSWELARLKALKEEEERRAEWEEDEMLFTYSRDSAYNQIYISDATGEELPMWAPPTPPQDDNDVYIDNTIFFVYEPMAMTETQLPPIYVKKERIRKPKVEIMSRRLLQKQASSEAAVQFQARKLKQRKEEQPRVPRSLFERPTAAILKLRKEAKMQKLKQGLIKPFRPLPSSGSKPVMDYTPDHPEWLIHEDWALLQAVQTLLDLPLNLMVVSPAHIPNWDLVSDVVNSCSRVYRSPKQCKNRYENVIIAREEGRILYDINPRKQKKTKGIYKDLPIVSSSSSSTQTKNNRPMKTSQLFGQDNNNSVTMLHSIRFDSVKGIATKRTPTLRPTLVNPTQKNPKHAAVLAESGITYDTPLVPEKVAAIRAERIQLEKKKSQAQAEQQLAAQRSQQAAQQQQQPVTATAVAQVAAQLQPVGTVTPTTVLQTATLQKTVVSSATIPAVSITRPVGSVANNIVVNTSPGVAGGTFAAINKRMSQQTVNLAQPATVKTLSPQTVSQAVRAQRVVTGTAMTVQDITTAVANQAQARTTLTTSAVVTTGITAAQLAATQRSIAGTSAVTGVSTVQQQLTQASKTLTPAQLTQLRQQTILKQQSLHPRLLAHHTQKITLTEQLRRQQQLKALQSQQVANQQLAGGQKVITSQLVTTVGQKTPALKHVTRPLTDADLQALLKKQQALQRQAVGGQTVAGQVQQIIAQAPLQQVGQASTSQTQVATLVKTVSAPGMPSVTIPVTQVGPVNINVSMAGQKIAGVKNPTVSQLQHQQFKQIQLQQLHRKALQQGKVTALGQAQVQQLTAKGQMPLGTAIQINRPLPMTVQQIQQLVKHQQQQQQQSGQAATIQQIITSVAPTQSSQPTLIATVTQAPPQPMVAKVSLATTAPTSQMQTITQATPITLAPGSQLPLTSQPPVATLSLTAASPQATPTGIVQSVTMTSVGTATVQMQPIQTVSPAQAKLATLTHTVPPSRVTHVVHQQVTPGQVTTVGRSHSLTGQTAPIATQQVVVTASPEPQHQLQAHIQRSAPVSAILTTSTSTPTVLTLPSHQSPTVAAIVSQATPPAVSPHVQAQLQVATTSTPQVRAQPIVPQTLPTRAQITAPQTLPIRTTLVPQTLPTRVQPPAPQTIPTRPQLTPQGLPTRAPPSPQVLPTRAPQALPTHAQPVPQALPTPAQPMAAAPPAAAPQPAPQQPVSQATTPQQPAAQQQPAAAPQPQPVKTTPYAMRLRNPPKH